jgi:hypothetical protein
MQDPNHHNIKHPPSSSGVSDITNIDDPVPQEIEDQELAKINAGKTAYSDFNEEFHTPRTRIESSYSEAMRIVKIIRNLNLPCPLTRYFMTIDNVKQAFENLKAYVPEWQEMSHDELKGHGSTLWLPSLFRGKGRQFVGKRNDWWGIDVCIDYFTEFERLSAKKEYRQSAMDAWNDDKILCNTILLCAKKKVINCQSLRDALFFNVRELALFRVTRAKSIIQMVLFNDDANQSLAQCRGLRWLDMSAGWGDRLMTACALQMDYLGFDPNHRLAFGHQEMISHFGQVNSETNLPRQRVVYQPFESNLSLQLIEADVAKHGLFDISLVSPPFYIIERYGGEGQSTDSYPEFEDWMVNFLFASLHNTWANLKDGGFLAINIASIRNCDIVGPMQLFIEDFLIGCQWEGLLTFSGKGTTNAPGIIYVWRKDVGRASVLWNPKIPRGLRLSFPILHAKWLRRSRSKTT